ncbi:DUF4291 domain-containing protein [Aetokthonos hydrillicola Thurmond2011]|jgi:hypothetical protein|uniref:DUF4291 domain-containing protein n=1 Tax=Aetokthonos hydrillicola Thurmond2011 TaxID=2712845 RepID=A0AAP5I7Y5_9CYAN|nr:DUF4291 domain-containing protein [Aetokthonos hydrillicola]MBO3460530.1 DUF4291 domain-containing protein [Aetokthonos hydrillicola CCALA 1050]MBW4585343.1 DUF4291 domain-containing protein [Aetokthonos hydrillicola CCALA 1050]MDR9896521.1 DUF4291 domain-containing protein [Aetokthonos hydrillicola Thurmond2011]
MRLVTRPYLAQVSHWPKTGRHILAQYDDQSIVVYQAYSPAIGHFAATHGYFGGEFKLDRMSWIKPNFLWMMYRSGWGTKPGQEVVLAIRIQREAFNEILKAAVHSVFVPELYPSRIEWEQQLKYSQVRLQWDPDHNPSGEKLERRAIQLGLRGIVLAAYARDWIVDIENISEFVCQQRQTNDSELITPYETVYPVPKTEIAHKLGINEYPACTE